MNNNNFEELKQVYKEEEENEQEQQKPSNCTFLVCFCAGLASVACSLVILTILILKY